MTSELHLLAFTFSLNLFSLKSSGELDFHVHAGMRKYEVDLKMWQHLLEHPLFAERAFHYINVLVSSLT